MGDWLYGVVIFVVYVIVVLVLGSVLYLGVEWLFLCLCDWWVVCGVLFVVV